MQTECQVFEPQRQKKSVLTYQMWTCGIAMERENKISSIFYTTSFPENIMTSTNYADIILVKLYIPAKVAQA